MEQNKTIKFKRKQKEEKQIKKPHTEINAIENKCVIKSLNPKADSLERLTKLMHLYKD